MRSRPLILLVALALAVAAVVSPAPAVEASTQDGATAALTDDSPSAQISRLYEAYFLRTPVLDERMFWVARLHAGQPLADISRFFASSDEFVARYGSLSDDEFVDLVYRNVLGRDRQASETFWIDELADGRRNRGAVMLGFSESPEFKQHLLDSYDDSSIFRLYCAYFLRTPDAGGRLYWKTEAANGADLGQISQQFASSAEFLTRYGTIGNAGFVNLVYYNILDRQPDTDGFAFWKAQLDQGLLSRGQVMAGFSESPEYQKRVDGVACPINVTEPPANGDLPLLTLDDFDYIGGVAIPAGTFGESSANYSQGPIEVNGNSLFFVGHGHQQAIAEFTLPALIDSTSIGDLNGAGDPQQNYASVLDRVTGGNPQNINRIGGLELHDGQLIVNSYEYYDAPADNTDTTLIIRNADQLDSSVVDGYLQLDGAARAAGWITEVPAEWQGPLGGTHLTGFASGIPITSRTSVGPSAYTIDADDILNASTTGLSSNKLLEFSLGNPLHEDQYNESRTNDLWTVTSDAVFGFIVPGTRTYVTVGSSSGHESGLGYKATQDNGNLCGGPCSLEAADVYNYYWLWDLNDLMAVKAGVLPAYGAEPYEYGEFPAPFQTDEYLNSIGGGSFDLTTGTLYLSVQRANNTVGTYSNPPIIAAYQFPQYR